MKTRTFDNAMTIVVMLNRITGVRELTSSNTWFWSSLSFLYKAIITSICIYSAYLNCSFTQTQGFNIIAVAIYIIISIVVLFSYLTMQVLGWQHYKEISILRKYIADTDRRLTNLNVMIDHRNMYIWTVAICIGSILNGFQWCIIYVLYWKWEIIRQEKYIFASVVHNIMLYVGGMVVMDFMLHVCWLEKSFKQTNDLLKKLFMKDCSIEMEDWNNKMEAPRLGKCLEEWRIGDLFCRNKVTTLEGTRIVKRQLSTSDKINVLQQIRYVYLQLCVITKLLNKIFDNQVMFHSIVTVQGVVTTLYYSYTQLVSKESHPEEHLLGLYMVDTCYMWMKVVVAWYFCEKTAKEAKQIVHIIYACTIHNSDIELKNELTQICLQVSLIEVDRKNTHLFWLNDSFMLQSIGGAFTYLLIMIQWNQTLTVPEPNSNLTTFTWD